MRANARLSAATCAALLLTLGLAGTAAAAPAATAGTVTDGGVGAIKGPEDLKLGDGGALCVFSERQQPADVKGIVKQIAQQKIKHPTKAVGDIAAEIMGSGDLGHSWTVYTAPDGKTVGTYSFQSPWDGLAYTPEFWTESSFPGGLAVDYPDDWGNDAHGDAADKFGRGTPADHLKSIGSATEDHPTKTRTGRCKPVTEQGRKAFFAFVDSQRGKAYAPDQNCTNFAGRAWETATGEHLDWQVEPHLTPFPGVEKTLSEQIFKAITGHDGKIGDPGTLGAAILRANGGSKDGDVHKEVALDH
ncbi:hypothetical protein [Streptomyces caatingaensis]|uniref:Uncharacterized protein n=1 Tax=Streptomyces caatingaensis TaxID=1678637 RepID=A0A0K9XJP8_9ACTN|nr:hypothetical protein [Streptomyces caatingaensis]KNB53538.1 hypothetical protein AC230_02475 [Streptomyces caatingaensis]